MKTIRNFARLLVVALVLTACAAGTPSPPPERTAGEYLDDTSITTKVKALLLNDPTVSGLDIQVETYKGTVQLSGFANSSRERDRAEALAETIQGVKSVKNDIRLKK